MPQFAQHPIIVTGGASGIGRAISKRLASEGASVGIFDLNGEAALACADQLRSAGGSSFAYAVDITDREAVNRAVAAFEADAGPIYGLVNNAGWDQAVNFVDSTPELWDKVIDINLRGPINVTYAALRCMLERGTGRVVSIASDAGRVGSSGEAVYSAAKGGIISFMKTLARELARKGITCNSVCPGPTDTPLLASFDQSGDGRLVKALERAIPMGRLGQPGDYPGIVAYFLSEEAAFVTGQTISVSGGLSMAG
jgi:2-hydroxycyclohexanecarboxyl-CoA dehydrogenase